MPNTLIATMPASGHVNPMIDIARKLVERGHTVHWYCARPFAPKIEAVGATLAEMRSIPQRGQGNGSKPLARLLRWLGFGGTMMDWKSTFIDPIENQSEELQAALEVFPPDVFLSDPVMFAAAIVAEDHNIPWAVLGITPLMLKSRDVPPFLLGMRPRYSILGRLWAAFLYWFVDQVVFREPLQYFESQARQNGWGFKSFPNMAALFASPGFGSCI